MRITLNGTDWETTDRFWRAFGDLVPDDDDARRGNIVKDGKVIGRWELDENGQ